MTTYNTRYQARKHASYGDVIVKVCAGGDAVGYAVMDARDYQIWRKQK